MKRTFILNLLFLIGINVLIKPLYLLGVERAVQNAATPAAYGIYFELFNFTFLFQILSDLGIQYFNSRHIAQHPFLLSKYFPYFLSAKGLLAILYLLCTVLGGFWMGYLPEHTSLVAILIGIQLLTTFLSFVRSNISGLGWYYTDSFLSVLDKLAVMLVLGIPLLMGRFSGGFPIIWLGWAQLAGLAVTVLVGLLLLFRISGIPSFKISKPFSWLILRESMPYAIAVLLMTLYTRFDAVLIGRFYTGGQEEVGYYAAAYRLLDAFNMIGVLFAGLLLPMYARSARNQVELRQLSETGIRLLWGGVLIVVPVLIVFADVIMVALYRHTTNYSGFLLRMLLLSFIPASGNYIFSTLLLATGHQGKVNRIYLMASVLSVFLNGVMVSSLGAVGASVAVVCTQALVFTGMLYGCERWMDVRVPAGLWLRFAGLALSVGGSAFVTRSFLGDVQLPLVFLLPLVIGVFSVFLFKIAEPATLWEMIKWKNRA